MSKRVVGGDYLLDLSSIEIEKSEDGTKTSITDADVLEQLTNLKKYVPNPNGIKPVWVKMKNGENNELVVARGTFANVGTGEFEICVLLNGYKLIISIEFTQALNEDEQPIDDWYIAENDAKYLFTSDYQRVVVEDVKNIDDNILSTLQCGDVVIKHDESGEHAYVVSYRGETGICLTYTDASCVETQSYDYIDGTGWVYNSEDKVDITNTKPIYCHPITIDAENETYKCHIAMLVFDNSNTEYNDGTKLLGKLNTIFALNPNAAFPITGGFYYQGTTPFIADKIVKDGTQIQLKSLNISNGNFGYFSLENILTIEGVSVVDGVNKIN